MALTSHIFTVAVAALFAAAAVLPVAEAQQQQQNCIGGLMKCKASFMNATKPSAECCVALKETVEKQLPCLCSILQNPTALASFNATSQKALGFTVSCGLKADPSMCSEASAPLPEAPAPTPESTKSDKGAASKIAGTGLTALFFVVVSTMFY